MSTRQENESAILSPRSDRVDAWDMDVHVGSVLGKYRLLAELGQGGMSNVFLAVARGPKDFTKLVVLKMLRPSLARDPQFLTMFLDEARLAARLNHPNVVQTNEVGVEDDRNLIAMEYLEGQPLSRLVQRAQAFGTPMTHAMHLRILADALNGLHYAHELTDFDGTPLHLVHRDISPQNIFVTYDGQVKVLDFGIAKAVTSSVNTTHGVVKGKVAYMSPEQFAGDHIDRRADIFAMGILLWECATGTRMWKKKSEALVLQAVLGGHIPSARSVEPSVDVRFEAICKRALALYPADRYATAFDLQHDVEHLIETLPMRVSHRDIGSFVSELFREERSAVRTIVEKQLMAAKRVPTGEFAAIGFAPTLASSQSPSELPMQPLPPHTSRPDGTPPSLVLSASFGSGAEDANEDALPARISGSHAGVAGTIRPPAPFGGWRWVAATVVGGAAFAFAGFYLARTGSFDALRSGSAATVAARGEVLPPAEPALPPMLTRAEPKPETLVAEPSRPPPVEASLRRAPRSHGAPHYVTAPSPRAPLPAQPSASAAPVAAPEPTHHGRKFRTDI